LISSMLTPSCSTISSETLVSSATILILPGVCLARSRSRSELCRGIELFGNPETRPREIARDPGDDPDENTPRPDLEHPVDARRREELDHLGEADRRGHLPLEQRRE